MFSKDRILRLFIPVALLATVMSAADVRTALSQSQGVFASKASQMMQFTSSGHVLGFQENCMYVASASHMLQENFVGTKGAVPQSDRMPAVDGQAQPGLWQGITLIYDNVPAGIVRSTYHIEPGAAPGQIALSYNVPVHLDASGNLVFEFETGTMTACAPIAWQENDKERMPVDVSFHLENSRSGVHFLLGNYNPDLSLIIDPTLIWNTFMGSTKSDYGYGIAVDDNGNVYVVGTSDANWGSPASPHPGDGFFYTFAAKLNTSGVRQWNTFMGGDRGRGIAVDGSGNVYVVGRSFDTWGSPVNAHAGGGFHDVFVAMLSGSAVLTQVYLLLLLD